MLLLFITAMVCGALAFYRYMTRNYGFFRSHGVPEIPGKFPFGSEYHKDVVSGKLAFVCSSEHIYRRFRHQRMVGHFCFGRPFLLVIDLDLAKAVMIKDADYFMDRRSVDLNTNVHVNRLTKNMLTALEGEKWKLLRSVLSPVFTSGKLKSMMPIMNKLSKDLVTEMIPMMESNEEVDIKAVMTDFTLNVIASCGFGVEANAFKHENNTFRDMVRNFAGQGKRGFTSLLRIMTILSAPRLASALGLAFFDEKPVRFLENVVRYTMAQRRHNSSDRRGDLIDLAMEALGNPSATASVVEDDQFERDAIVKPSTRRFLSDTEMEEALVASALQLLQAGYDTTSTILSVILFFLAKHPDVQDEAQAEVVAAVPEVRDIEEMTYHDLQKLAFLDMVIHEAMRHYPLTVVERRCVKDYRVPGTDFVIPKDMIVQIPTLAIMKDERYFPNPDRFDPRNFSEENKAKRSPYAFLAFGQGPRNCIGMRFAMLQMKIVLVHILSRFRVTPCPKTVGQLVPDPLSPSGQPTGGIFLRIESR